MKKTLAICGSTWAAIVAALVLSLALPSISLADRKVCSDSDPEYSDTGKRMKCKMENLNDAFDGVVTTALSDDTGAFSEAQKKQLENLNARAKSETGRTSATDFKQMGKKHARDTACSIQEILGDVTVAQDESGDATRPGFGNGVCDPDEGEVCIGDEDGICQVAEYVQPRPYNGGCAEVVGDGIGNDDGVCDPKGGSGRFREVCIEVCDPDLVLVEGDETNVDRGKADDMEQALDDVTDVLDDANSGLEGFIATQRLAAEVQLFCDNNALTPCEYLACLGDQERSASSQYIRDLTIGAAAAQLVAETCRDAGDQSTPVVFVGGSIDWRIVCLPLGLAANGVSLAATIVELRDDLETAERLDATAACAQQAGGDVVEVKAMLERAVELLQLPPGQRPSFPTKPVRPARRRGAPRY